MTNKLMRSCGWCPSTELHCTVYSQEKAHNYVIIVICDLFTNKVTMFMLFYNFDKPNRKVLFMNNMLIFQLLVSLFVCSMGYIL